MPPITPPLGTRPILVALLAGALVFVGCSPTAPSSLEQLEQARERWERTEPAEHRYVLQRLCECRVTWTMAMVVTVRHGTVDTVTAASASAAADDLPPQPDPEAALTIDELLDRIADAIDADAHRLQVTYDPDYGFPAELYIDGHPQIADDEVQFSVREFEPID